MLSGSASTINMFCFATTNTLYLIKLNINKILINKVKEFSLKNARTKTKSLDLLNQYLVPITIRFGFQAGSVSTTLREEKQ